MVAASGVTRALGRFQWPRAVTIVPPAWPSVRLERDGRQTLNVKAIVTWF